MNLFFRYPANKKYLLPLVMAVVVFFISQGIAVPNFNNLEGPQLAGLQKVKSSYNVVVKTLAKCSQIKTTKSDNSFALVDNALRKKNPALPVSVYKHQSHRFISAAVSVIPARAPPA